MLFRSQYGIVPVRLRAGQRSASRELRKHLLANRAGSIAEERYTGRRNEIGAFADDLEFRQCLREMYGERLDRHARDLSRQAQRLVADHWQAIVYVADALIQLQQLSFAAVAQLAMSSRSGSCITCRATSTSVKRSLNP